MEFTFFPTKRNIVLFLLHPRRLPFQFPDSSAATKFALVFEGSVQLSCFNFLRNGSFPRVVLAGIMVVDEFIASERQSVVLSGARAELPPASN